MPVDLDLLDLYQQASDWTLAKVAGAATMGSAPTTCPGWNVSTLMSHVLETQRYFVAAAGGRDDATPPSPTPPDLVTKDPVADLSQLSAQMLRVFGQPGVLDKTGSLLGIAFSDQLLHGWDLATSTGQDPTMPEGLANAAYQVIHGRFTEEQRIGVFKPEIPVPPGSSAEDKLLAYTGRDPATIGPTTA